jgi:hypothetical protein
MNALRLSAAQSAARAPWKAYQYRGGIGRAVFSDEALGALLDAGCNQAEAARRLGVTPAAVCLRIKRRGWK